MSDFIYSNNSIERGKLSKEIRSIYHEDIPAVEEYHGDWGSLAVSRNLYNRFQSYETTEHICVVIGGPSLCFSTEDLSDEFVVSGTKAIYYRWLEGKIKWDEDLSGPFAILIVNKNTKEIQCITDLMAFIPVYSFQDETHIMISTHVDALGRASIQQDNVDVTSMVDFILNGVITFPYTIYNKVKQIAPATEHVFNDFSTELQYKSYWVPFETNRYKSINKAADDTRQGLLKYVRNVSGETSIIAQFISGGEDSRTLSGLLPKERKRDAYIFLDQMNREGKVAKKAANAYGTNFNLSLRSKLHYLEILAPCVDLVGSGAQYKHAHTFGFHKSCKLSDYPAVFGGLFSDALLKGARIKKIRGSGRLPFLPQVKRKGYSSANLLKSSTFTPEVLLDVTSRRQSHLKYVSSFRSESSEEWFELWPSSMNMNIPNLHVNRRLFPSYEPFMSNDIVKISAEVPQKWKLNRRLFHRAAKPLLKPTMWLLHGDGRLPYFPWYINFFVGSTIWCGQQLATMTGLVKGDQGPWGEMDFQDSQQWEKAISEYSDGLNIMSHVLMEKNVKRLFNQSSLDSTQRINLMQVIYINHQLNGKSES